MRPSQVTHQGRLYYHCAFTAPAKHPLEMHTYICSRYLYMYACSWVCHSEWETGHAWSVCCVSGKQRDCVWSSAVHCVTHFVWSTCAAFGLKKNVTFPREWLLTLKSWLVLLQDAQLYPNVVTASVSISWSSWLWPWTLPTRCTWWLMGNSELRSGSVLHDIFHDAQVACNIFTLTLHKLFIGL